ncbi:MAG: Gfo/Idh/MocA family oxidoreductase [Armatimonadetes bacterium]|nr:Gfo/Idh/MocA family oxidoreductase [Armatimonadota bacterium]
MDPALRAAVIGAGKIGRHHAKWYHRAGCTLVGYAVSSPESVATRATEMQVECPEVGVGYTDIGALLDEQRPDLVSVCTPAEHHYAAARLALERGVAVLCEKPLVWSVDPATARREAADLVALSEASSTPLAVNLQYTYAADSYRELVAPAAAPRRCEVVLESRGKGAERTPAEVWMELGPHALSLAFGLLPGYELDLASVTVETAPRTALAGFALDGPESRVQASVRCGQVMEGDLTRCFGLDGQLVDYAGRNNAAGDFCTYLKFAGLEHEYADLMRSSIERFVAALRGESRRFVDGRAGLRNLEAQLAVTEAIHRSLERRADG